MIMITAPDLLHDFAQLCRTANPALALAAVILLCMRIGETIVDRTRQDRLLGLIFVLYVLLSGLGSMQAKLFGSKVGPVTVGFALLHTGLIVLMLLWDSKTPAGRSGAAKPGQPTAQ